MSEPIDILEIAETRWSEAHHTLVNLSRMANSAALKAALVESDEAYADWLAAREVAEWLGWPLRPIEPNRSQTPDGT